MLRFAKLPLPFRAISSHASSLSTHSVHQLFDQFHQEESSYKSAHQLFDQISQRTLHPFLTNPISFSKSLSYYYHFSAFVISSFHGLAIVSGLIFELPVSNSLINAYSKSGYSDSALKLFQTAPNRDTISWNTIISSLNGISHAMVFLLQMVRNGFSLDSITLTTILSFSAESRDFLSGWQIHLLALKTGLSNRFISNKLITFYSRTGFLQDAQKVFDEMILQDLVSWNALICGFAQNGDNTGFEANHLFLKMLSKKDKIRPDIITIVSVMPVCGSINLGRQIHCFSTKIGVSDDLSVCNVLISMYYKYGEIDSVKNVFNRMRVRNVVSWTSMISMDSNNAVCLFKEMILHGIKPNLVTFIALMYSIPNNYSIRDGCMVHSLSYKYGLLNNINVSNSLITMYARLGQMDFADKVFDEIMHEREIITWNALISGYQQNGFYEKALEIFSSLISFLKPNQYTFGSVLSAITGAETLSLTFGQMCHCYIVKLGFNTNEFVSSALIDMYAKQGLLKDSDKLFNEREKRSILSWTSIISAHAKHANYEKVMGLFENMVKNYKIAPDGFILLSVLMVCGSKGMVQNGKKIFNSIFNEYKIEPWPEHYSCMVDMLGKANKIQEAEHLMHLMPNGPTLSALQSLLNACRIHGDNETGKRVADLLLETGLSDSGAFVSISNIFAERGEWESVARVRKGMREKGVRKEVGFSWVDLGFLDRDLRVYKFASDDCGHPLVGKIYEIVESLGVEMKILQEDLDVEMDVLV